MIDIQAEFASLLCDVRIACLFFVELLEQAIDRYRVAINPRKKLVAVVGFAARQ